MSFNIIDLVKLNPPATLASTSLPLCASLRNNKRTLYIPYERFYGTLLLQSLILGSERFSYLILILFLDKLMLSHVDTA
jgi:hypothetical protein